MKKTTLLLFGIACAIFMLAATSCKKDDNPTFDSKLLVGEWYLSNYKGFETFGNGERDSFDESYTVDKSWIFLTFTGEGKGEQTALDGDDSYVNTFSWSLSGDQLKMIDDDGLKVTKTVTELTSTTFVTHDEGTDQDGPYEDFWTFTKMK